MIKVPRSVFILELKEEAVKMVIEGGPDRPGGMPQAFACRFYPCPPGDAGKEGWACNDEQKTEPGDRRTDGACKAQGVKMPG